MKSEKPRPYVQHARAAAAAATRERIRDAAAALHAEKLWDGFSLAEVAARAGVSVQTVLRVFGSKHALLTLAAGAADRRQRAATEPGDVAAAVRAVCDDYEAIGAQVMRRLADAPRDPEVAAMVEIGRRRHREWVEAAFAPQLAAAPAEARGRRLAALILATDVYAWHLLVRDLKLDRAEAERVLTEIILAVTGGENEKISVGLLGRRRQPAAEPGDRGGAGGARA